MKDNISYNPVDPVKAAENMDGPLPEGLAQEWSTFLRGKHSLDGVFNHPVLFPLQRRKEMESMHAEAARICPKTIMEIGSDKGGSVYAWATMPGVESIIACEIRGTPYELLFEYAFPDIDFLWLPQSSYDPDTVIVVKQWLAMFRPKIDCLFIDGDKCNFSKDFECYLPMMADNSIVFMHDVNDEAPGASFRKAIEAGYRHKVIVDRTDSAEAIQRKQRGDPILSAHEGWLRHWRGRSCTVGVIYLGDAGR